MGGPKCVRGSRQRLGLMTTVISVMLAGCVEAPLPGPSLLALPGQTSSPAQFAADDARCRSSAASQAGVPANIAATDPQAGTQTGSEATQERYNASYGNCMIAAGEQIPAAQGAYAQGAYAQGSPPYGASSVDTTVDPYAYGGYGNVGNVPVTTVTGPVYATTSGWGWGWGWDGWYGGLGPAYGYSPWVPFGVGLGWGYGWGGWGWGHRWGWGGYGGWHGWGGYGGWHGGWGGYGGWHGGGWGGGGWGGGWHGGGFRR